MHLASHVFQYVIDSLGGFEQRLLMAGDIYVIKLVFMIVVDILPHALVDSSANVVFKIFLGYLRTFVRHGRDDSDYSDTLLVEMVYVQWLAIVIWLWMRLRTSLRACDFFEHSGSGIFCSHSDARTTSLSSRCPDFRTSRAHNLVYTGIGKTLISYED